MNMKGRHAIARVGPAIRMCSRNIDRIVGKDFEAGLANLKRLAEK